MTYSTAEEQGKHEEVKPIEHGNETGIQISRVVCLGEGGWLKKSQETDPSF